MALPPLELAPVTVMLKRLESLPIWPLDWELDFVRVGRWITPRAGAPYRPLRCICCPLGLCLTGYGGPCAPGEPRVGAVCEAFLRLQREFAEHSHLPEHLFLRDAALAAELEPVLAPLGIEIELVDELPAVERQIDLLLAGTHGGRAARRSFGADVSIAQVHAFAIAAAEFHDAAPWQRLGPHELVRVITPEPPAGFAAFAVRGGAGGACGLEFQSTERDLAACVRARAASPYRLAPQRWRFTLEPITAIPIADSELWERFALPVAAPGAYPMFVRYPARGKRVSATPAQFEFLEGLLRALCRYTPVDFELGHVRQSVRTFSGERDVVFVIPGRVDRLRPGQLFASDVLLRG